MTRVKALVRNHQNSVGLGLGALVLLTLIFDYFVGFGGVNLIGLRFVYLVLVSLIISYLYLVSTSPDRR